MSKFSARPPAEGLGMSILSSVSSSATAKQEKHLAKHQNEAKESTTGVFIEEKKMSKKKLTRGLLLACREDILNRKRKTPKRKFYFSR
jgi:hypothetical protein